MKRSVLLIVDAQVDMLAEGEPVYQAPLMLERLNNLIQHARQAGVPVIFIQNNGGPGEPDEPGSPGWPIHPQLSREPEDYCIEKSLENAFEATGLTEILQELLVNHVVIAGMLTNYCVAATLRGAVELGFAATLVADAHSTVDEGGETAEAIIERYNRELAAIAQVVPAAELEW